MTKVLLKVTAGLIAVFLLVLGMVAIALPRLIDREDFQAALHEAASTALGAPVEWQSMEAGILPPRLTIRNPVLLTAAPGTPDESLYTATSIDLRLAILPIFQSRIEVASLVVRGAEIVMIRTEEGLSLPPALMSPPQPIDSEKPTDAGEASAFDLAIRHVAVSESRLILHDRTRSPAVEWRIEDFELTAGARVATASLEIEMAARIQSGEKEVGRIGVSGDVDLDGSGDLEIEIDGLLVESLAPYLEAPEVSGVLSGHISIAGTGSEVTKIDLDLRVEEASIRTAGAEIGGLLRLQASRVNDDPFACKATFDFGDGGQVNVDGTSTLDARLDLRARIDSLDLAILEPFLPDSGMELGGLARGKARIVGPAQSLEFVELDVHVDAGRLHVPDYQVAGPFDVELRIDAPLSGSPRGRIVVDLTAATLEYQALFKKRAGMRAELTTEFSTNKSGQTEFESRIKFRDIDEIILRGAIGESTSIAMTAPRFDLDGWSEVFPALEPYSLGGKLAFDGVGIESLGDSPERFRGRILFERVALTIPSGASAELDGSLVGQGTKVRIEDLRLIIGGTTFGITGELANPLGSNRFDLAIQSLGASEANDLFSALSSVSDTIYGDLQIAGKLSGVLGGDVDLYSSLNGALRISIGESGNGRLLGVSILQTILGQFPILGGVARLSRSFRSGKSIDHYFTEEFELINGDFEIGEGKVNARKLRLVYEGYEVNLTGPVLLPSLEIDMTGDVLLKADLVSVLGGLLGTRSGVRDPVRIPLAHVTNTLSEPKIEMTSKTLAGVSELLFEATGLEALGLGLGRALGRALGDGPE
jgi:hypothetical protein